MIFYTICFENIPNAFSKMIFGKSYGHISKIFRDVLNTLHCKFVNKLNTGWDRIKIKNDTPQYVKDLHSLTDDQTLLMTDGVMMHVPRSGQVYFQKREFNKQKQRNCLTFMPIITTSGSHVTCLGPYNSDKCNNDAAICTAATDMKYNDWREQHPGDDKNMYRDINTH